MTEVSTARVTQMARRPTPDLRDSDSVLQDLLRLPPMEDTSSRDKPGVGSPATPAPTQCGKQTMTPAKGPSKWQLAAASPVALPVTKAGGQTEILSDASRQNDPEGPNTKSKPPSGTIPSGPSDDSSSALVLATAKPSYKNVLIPPPALSKAAARAYQTTRNCDCRAYWPRIDEHNVSVRLGPSQNAASLASPALCDDFLSELVPMSLPNGHSKKVRAGNTTRSLPGDLLDTLKLGNRPQDGRPTPCKTARSRGSSAITSPRAITLQQLGSIGGSLGSQNGRAVARSDTSPWSAPSSASNSMDEPAQAKNVEQTLGEIFRSLKTIIPDVLAACDNDGTAAYERLQQMQDDNAVVEWNSPPKATTVYHSLAEKIGILAEQYSEVPRRVIEECLRRHGEDLDRASAQLLMTKDNNEDRATEEHDRALALELSQSSPPQLQYRGQFSAPVELNASPGSSDWVDMGSKAVSGRARHLQACFPTAPTATIQSILTIANNELKFAKEILRDAQYKEVQSAEGYSSQGSSANSHSSRSPPRDRESRHRNHQAVYEEHRAQGNAINKNIIQKVQKIELLKQEGRYNDASMLEAQIPELKRQARRADQFAKESIFESMNKDNCAMREIDLHGLHRREAIEKVHTLVEYSINDPMSDTFCKVVTGWGKGSQDNIPKLRPAVEEYLDRRGITHGLEVGNTGMVCFCITRGQRLKPYDERF